MTLSITLRGGLRGVDAEEARHIAPLVESEIRLHCCRFFQGDFDAGETLCYPTDWPVQAPLGVDPTGYANGRAEAARDCGEYDHEVVRAFQEAAGLDPDGVYGPMTKGALRYFGVPHPPDALVGHGEIAYGSRPAPRTVPGTPAELRPRAEPVVAGMGGGAVLGLALALGIGVWALGRRR